MRKIYISFSIGIFSSVILSSCSQHKDSKFPKLQGPYFGQTPPGTNAEMFAHDLLHAGKAESYIRFSPDGKEMLCGLLTDKGTVLIEPMGVFGKGFTMYSRLDGGYWTESKEFIYPYDFRFVYASFSPDGSKIVFNSYGPGGSEENNPQSRTWYIDRVNYGWGEPK